MDPKQPEQKPLTLLDILAVSSSYRMCYISLHGKAHIAAKMSL